MKIASENQTNHAIREYANIMENVLMTSIPARSADDDPMPAYRLGSRIIDNAAYSDHGRGNEDVKDQLFDLDPQAKKNMMIVMSNTMSMEDYQGALEEGFDLADIDQEQAVTIIDHIKTVMAESGRVVAGYNDDISAEKLEAITGSVVRSNDLRSRLEEADLPVSNEIPKKINEARELLKDVDSLSEASVKYLVDNDLPVTIGNVYMAKYSGAGDPNRQAKGYFSEDFGGYMSKKADRIVWTEIEPQIESSVEQMNLGEISHDEAMNNAKWLLEKGLPVTESRIIALSTINNLKLPIDDERIRDICIRAIGEGKQVSDANLADNYSTPYVRAKEFMANVEEIEDKDLEFCLEEDKKLNIRNLKLIHDERVEKEQKEAQERAALEAKKAEEDKSNRYIYSRPGSDFYNLVMNGAEPEPEVTEESIELIHARRNLEEIRLKMTLEVNIRLIRQGKQIDTVPISELVDIYEEREKRLRDVFLGKLATEEEAETKSNLFTRTVRILKDIPSMPVSVLGRLEMSDKPYGLMDIHTGGEGLKAEYEQAGSAYESIMTSPRKDLGDSINKAFRNIDEILKDIGFENSPENNRAVRILGYNGMAVTKEAVVKIKAADRKVTEAIKALTPARTIDLIRKGIDPLDADIDELTEAIKEIESDPAKDAEKYSRFLYKLEQSGNITEKEKESYIGIYRMLNTLEKNDHAAVGALLDSGAKITFGNLVKAVRSARKDIDVKVDDSFGFLQGIVREGKSITEQIESAIAEKIGKERYQRFDERYTSNMLEEYRHVCQNVSEETIAQLDDNMLKVSINNIEAFESFTFSQNSFYNNINKYARKIDNMRKNGYSASAEADLIDKIERFGNSFDSKETTETAFDDLAGSIEKILANMSNDAAESVLDYKNISLMFKQLSMVRNLANEENYHVPLIIRGKITDVNVRLVHGNEQGVVAVSVRSERYGQIRGECRMIGDELRINFTIIEKDWPEHFSYIETNFREELGKLGYDQAKIHYIVGNPKYKGKFAEEKADNNNEGVATEKLYHIAKAFIAAVSNRK